MKVNIKNCHNKRNYCGIWECLVLNYITNDICSASDKFVKENTVHQLKKNCLDNLLF